MDIRNRILLPLYDEKSVSDTPQFDFGSLFLHLLLFETVIVPSLALEDIAALAKSIGAPSATELLRSGSIKIRAAADAIGSFNLPERQLIQLQHYSGADPDASMNRYSEALNIPGISVAEKNALEEQVREHWIRPAQSEVWGLEAIRDTNQELIGGTPGFYKAVERELLRKGKKGITLSSQNLRVEMQDSSKGILRFRYRIPGISVELASQAIRNAALAIARINGDFAKMRRDHAISIIDGDATPLLEEKLKFLWAQLDQSTYVRQFSRVERLAGLPDFNSAIAEGGIDIDKFLRIRSSPEISDFRDFLRHSDTMSDASIEDNIRSVRAKVGNLVRSDAGKIARVIFTSVIGLMADGITAVGLGAAASAIDSFIVEQFFPASGVVALLGKYPSMFQSNDTRRKK